MRTPRCAGKLPPPPLGQAPRRTERRHRRNCRRARVGNHREPRTADGTIPRHRRCRPRSHRRTTWCTPRQRRRGRRRMPSVSHRTGHRPAAQGPHSRHLARRPNTGGPPGIVHWRTRVDTARPRTAPICNRDAASTARHPPSARARSTWPPRRTTDRRTQTRSSHRQFGTEESRTVHWKTRCTADRRGTIGRRHSRQRSVPRRKNPCRTRRELGIRRPAATAPAADTSHR